MKSARPFHVSTFGLSPDLTRVDPAFGTINRGDVARTTLIEVLERFRKLDTEWGPTGLRMVIQSELGRFVVARMPGQQLTLAGESEPQAERVQLTTEQIIARLETAPKITFAPPPPPAEPMWRTVVALVLLAAGVALTIRALNSVFSSENGAQLPEDITLVTEPADIKARQNVAVGVFATGQQPGDRHLTISADGHLVFTELGARQSIGSGTDTYRMGRRDRHTFLVTAQTGVIEVVDFSTLVHFGDTYRRVN